LCKIKERNRREREKEKRENGSSIGPWPNRAKIAWLGSGLIKLELKLD